MRYIQTENNWISDVMSIAVGNFERRTGKRAHLIKLPTEYWYVAVEYVENRKFIPIEQMFREIKELNYYGAKVIHDPSLKDIVILPDTDLSRAIYD